jgi:PAS domain S-box-containing protein
MSDSDDETGPSTDGDYRDELLRITADPELAAEEKTRRLLELGCDRLGLDNGHLVRIDAERGRHEVVSVFGSDVVETGVTDLSNTYCRRTVESDGVFDVYDASAEGWGGDPAYERFGLESYIGTKLRVEGRLYGTLCFASDEARSAPFTADEREFLDLLGGWFSQLLARRRELNQAETVLENAQDAVFLVDVVCDGEFEVERVNRAYGSLTGMSTDDITGKTPEAILGAEAGAAVAEHYQECVDRRERVEYEETLSVEGERRHWHTNLSPVVEDGRVVKLVGATRDITERRRQWDAITELHETARTLMEADETGAIAAITVEAVRDVLGIPVNTVWLADEGGEVLRPAAWTGRVAEAVGEPPTVEPGDGLAWTVFADGEMRRVDEVDEAEDPYTRETPIRSQILLPLADQGVVSVGATGPGAFDERDIALAETVTAHARTALQRSQRQADLRDERAFIEQALDTLGDVFYVIDSDGDMLRWNERLREVGGYDDEEIADMRPMEFFPEDEREKIAAAIDETLTSGESSVEADFLTADGERIPYELTGRRLTDAEGEVIGLVGVGRDVSRQKERERELRRQNERLEEFASLVSHDLRNPLNIAMGHLSIARDERDSDSLRTVADAHERMRTLIDDLLELARGGEDIEEAPVALAHVVDQSLESVDTGDASVDVDVTHTVHADESRLKQLVENLVRNASDHGGETVTVRIGDLEDGFYVEDDGPGVPGDERDAIFESGYSTGGEGAGLGLRIVARVVDAHDWEIAVSEGSDGGARFEITGVDVA